MTSTESVTHFIAFPHLSITGANAISSPITHGFPSITSFIGLMWALQRKMSSCHFSDISLLGVGVVCHRHKENALPYWAGIGTGMVKAFSQPRTPLTGRGEVAPIIEGGKVSLDVSLIFSISCARWTASSNEEINDDLEQIRSVLMTMRVAGGLAFDRPDVSRGLTTPWSVKCSPDRQENERLFSDLRFALAPGFALVSRHQLLLESVDLNASSNESAERRPVETLLSFCQREWVFRSETGDWKRIGFDSKNWLCPIPVGYVTLTRGAPPNQINGSRNHSLRHFFVESVYSLGEWVSPHRIASLEDLIWRSNTKSSDGVFACENSYEKSLKN